ncbi:hypothetical protein ACWEWX_48205, partial [Streptomyces asiaticus]
MDLVKQMGPLLAAEAAAEAHGVGVEPAELEQAVWLRLLERTRDTGAIVSPDGKDIQEIKPKAHGKLPMSASLHKRI